MSWVDGHQDPHRIRQDVWSGFEQDWTIETERTKPIITLSKNKDVLVFVIGEKYPSVAPTLYVNGEECGIDENAWNASKSLDWNATKLLERMAMMEQIQSRVFKEYK